MKKVNVTLIGHKDHGKSTLIGRLLFESGSIKDDKIREVKSIAEQLGKPFEYAFLLDSFREEREIGFTLDVIHAQVKTPHIIYEMIDVPGHKELIKNMLTGASHADYGIAIVSTKEGIEEQTKEHLMLAGKLGLDQLIVAVNKLDVFNYSKEVFDKTKKDVSEILKSFGYDLNKIYFIPVSALNGDNVGKISDKMKWYNGLSLLETMLKNFIPKDLPVNEKLRMPVQDIYDTGEEKIVLGKIETGRIEKNDTLLFLPSKKVSKVEKIIVANKEVGEAIPGENVGLILNNGTGLSRGEVCCNIEAPLTMCKEIESEMILLTAPNGELIAECGTKDVKFKTEKIPEIKYTEVLERKILFDEPIVMEMRDGYFNTLQRFAIKDNGLVIGVGLVKNIIG